MTTDSHNTALEYAHRGWRVIPILPGTKRPAVNQWQDAATTSTAQINQWFKGSQSSCGVGIATGKASGIWVLDIDDRDALYELEREHGELPATLTSITGSGGEHQIYLWPADGRTIHNSASGFAPGIDVRGEGGQIVAPPTIHPNGNPYEWDEQCTEIAAAPEWLLDLICDKDTPQAPVGVSPTSSSTDRPGDLWANQTDWAQILQPDGWQLSHTDRNGERYWVRPGKEPRDGISATTGNTHNDNLHVFTSSVPNLRAEETYTKIGYLAAIHHNGDHAAAARALAAQGFTTPTPDLNILNHLTTTSSDDTGDPNPNPLAPYCIDFNTFWDTDHQETEWLLEPLFAKGRAHAIYAGAKVGKSFVTLAACAALATGRPFLRKPESAPQHVLYVDYEMTPQDLKDRLIEFGYDKNVFEYLHYAQLPVIAPLDTSQGGIAINQSAQDFNADLVIIDTTGRAVQGEENDAGTYQDFYRHTGMVLKQQGITWARLDHAGKDTTKGQRGSSAKNDDVDIVINLARTDHGITWTATHRRMSWYPEKSTINIAELDDVATFTMQGGNLESFEPHIFQLSDWMDAQGIPSDLGSLKCREHISTISQAQLQQDLGRDKVTKRDIETAVRYRKSSQYSLQKIGRDAQRDATWDATAGQTAGHSGTEPETHTNKGGTEDGTLRDTIPQAQRDTLSPCKGDRVHSPQPEQQNQPTSDEF
jgi:hypothetical protein